MYKKTNWKFKGTMTLNEKIIPKGAESAEERMSQ